MVSRRSCFVIVFVAFVLTFAANAFGLHPNVHARTMRRHVRRVAWHPMFRGSHDMLVRQNQEIDRLELPRIEDEQELADMEENGTLVPVRETLALEVASDLTGARRYCRPWTRDFLQDLSQAFYREFRRPLHVTSLVRTMEQQRKLRRHNRNAGPVDGDTASTHLTGITVDISRKGLTGQQHNWIIKYLLPLKDQGLIEPVEERRQAVFHVVVYGGYSQWREGEGSLTRMSN